MYARPAAPWWRRPLGVATLVVALVLAVGVAGVVLGRATGTSSSSGGADDSKNLPPVSKASLNTPHGPTRMQGELPVGFTDDQGGALSLAATAAEALIDYVQARRTTSVATWTSVYTSGQLSNLSLQKIYNWNPQIANVTAAFRPDHFGPQLNPWRGVIDVVPVGYKQLAFTPAAAHVVVWFHGLGWKQGSDGPGLVVDDAIDVQLAWTDGDWKITSIVQPKGTHWGGPTYGEPDAGGYSPWPGGQFTLFTG
jgi:hypothetical protein